MRKLTPQEKYHKKSMTSISFRLHNLNDIDILERLYIQDNKAGYIKNLIRQDIEKNKGTQ